ncbi:MAG: aromatic amino acid transaminase [Paracoccaceae bacterium]
MFASLKEQPADKILALMQMFKDDPREQKIDLGVGVYKDAQGHTPIMRAVKAAEKALWDVQDTKTYVGLVGDVAFSDVMIDLLLGKTLPRDAIAAAATPGGTGAVRQAFELAHMANPDVRIFVSDPTWPNHLSILKHLGIEMVPYRYFDAESRGVDHAGMLEDLSRATAGEIVLLHGCCHNPTGANLNMVQWQDVIDVLLKTGATPMNDIAYQGFGDGLDDDAAPTSLIVKSVPETIIAASCSKNFGIYRERTGILIVTAQDTSLKGVNQGTLAYLNRQNFSFPPDHGARLVTMILNDKTLRADWEKELEDTRLSMLSLRKQLAEALQNASGSNRFGFLADHRGMFSRLGTTSDKVDLLREKHGVYMVGDSRLNIAGLNAQTIPILANAIIDCGI